MKIILLYLNIVFFICYLKSPKYLLYSSCVKLNSLFKEEVTYYNPWAYSIVPNYVIKKYVSDKDSEGYAELEKNGKAVKNEQDALQGAEDIIAEIFA